MELGSVERNEKHKNENCVNINKHSFFLLIFSKDIWFFKGKKNQFKVEFMMSVEIKAGMTMVQRMRAGK